MPIARRSRSLPPPAPDSSGAGLLLVLAALIAVAIAFVATDGRVLDLAARAANGSGDVRGALGEPGATQPPPASPAASLPASPLSVAPSVTPSATTPPAPTPTPTPRPVRRPTSVNLLNRAGAEAIFVSEKTDTLCAAAAVQMTVEMLTGRTDRSARTQRRIHELEVALTTRTDSHNGGAGPLGMAATIGRLTRVKYELRIAATRWDALRDAAATIARTRRPVVLMAWRGAHAWVMTGFRADADPRVFGNATIHGAYVLDPWYPRVSSIWGPSDPPNAYQPRSEMIRNYLAWKRPEGRYPGRDGRFLYLAPVERGG